MLFATQDLHTNLQIPSYRRPAQKELSFASAGFKAASFSLHTISAPVESSPFALQGYKPKMQGQSVALDKDLTDGVVAEDTTIAESAERPRILSGKAARDQLKADGLYCIVHDAFGRIFNPDLDADDEPLVLNQKQVAHLSTVLEAFASFSMSLSNLSDQGTVATDSLKPMGSGYDLEENRLKTRSTAIEMLGLSRAFSQIARTMQEGEQATLSDISRTQTTVTQAHFVALPETASQPLEALMELQSLLDPDSFASLLGDLPDIRLLTSDQAVRIQEQVRELSPESRIEAMIFVELQLRTSGLTIETENTAHTIESSASIFRGTAETKTVSRMTPASQAGLPDWLFDVPLPTAKIGYAPQPSVQQNLGNLV